MFLNCNIFLFALFIFCVVLRTCKTTDVTVSSYNLWNLMFNWDVRKHRIAEMIKGSNSDIVAFQEVRMDYLEKKSQVLDLKKLLPEYRWAIWRSANLVNQPEDYVMRPWLSEGIGLLSKHPIIDLSVQKLPHRGGPDTNRRIAFHAVINMGKRTVVNVIGVHFSYDRQQQCQNAAALLEYIRLQRMKNIIMLGDFNTYNNFEFPIRIFTDRVVDSKNQCHGYLLKQKPPSLMLYDSWLHGQSRGNGYTFSNMPHPGLESRPDRILVSKSSFKVKLTSLTGNGTRYRKNYQGAVKFKRLRTLIKNAFYTAWGYTGYSCLHDCGPRGSCRCGVCIKGDNSHQCRIPDCEECNSIFVFILISYFLFLTLMIVLFLYALLRVLIISAKFNPQNFFAIMGCTCCLFNPKLYSIQRLSSRHRILKIILPVAKLPPMALLFGALVVIGVLLFIGEGLFQSVFETVNLVMDEEYYPSDHLMYTVRLEFLT